MTDLSLPTSLTTLGRVDSPLRPTHGLRRLYIHDLDLMAEIGVYPEEKGVLQPIAVSVDLLVTETEPGSDDLAAVVCYATLADEIRALVTGTRVNLVETLADRIARLCLVDGRVRTARVRVEKRAVMPDARAVGVEIERSAG